GAIRESQHVFIKEGLFYQAMRNKNIAILETGFGTGLNAWLTLNEAKNRDLQIYYETLEAYPISLETASTLNYQRLLSTKDNDIVSPDDFLELHRCNWEERVKINDHFEIRKRKEKFEEASLEAAFDLIYFDAFAPRTQPHLWEEPFLSRMYKSLKPEGVLVTYCAKGSFKRALKSLGFAVESPPGPPGKREMTRALKSV
ncbi:MAG: tRNA (5-methylaminomethyl-2-thiouridine)(34)-methyltransferase MnmD, partial [Saprospiraceae bacterium]|nr:tRNA (5-methylaminomethyl-2-thiouridine)(34)-methyltransferase MnmD [Saprospiraceae bacterium]